MQPSGQPTTQPSGQPTNRPSGQPSMQPTGQPTTQPSGLPTTQPSGQPTTVPSGQPSGVPTSVPSVQPTGEPSSSPTREAVTVTYANGTSFEISNNGLHFVSTRTFDQLGLEERQTFLSAYVWDTGFGPSTGQYVEFFVGGLPGGRRVPVLSSNGSAVHCAPRKVGQPSCLRQQWSACFYNFDVTGVLNSLEGGTLTVYAKSNGVLASTCPYRDPATGSTDIVFIRYDISVGIIPTPYPTAAPTEAGTKAANQNIYSGLSIDVGEMGYAFAMQIVAIGFCIFAAVGVAVTRVTEHERCESHQHKMLKAAIEWGLTGADTVNFAFMVTQLFDMHFQLFAYSLLGLRAINAIVALYLLGGVYGSKAHQNRTSFANLLDRKHLLLGLHAKLYAVCSFVVLLELQIVAYLPWLNSPFTRMSMGFPNYTVYRIVSIETIMGSLATIGLQIPFLMSQVGHPLSKGFSWINIGLSCVKLLLAIVTHFLKTSSLVDASTDHDLVDLKQWAPRETSNGTGSLAPVGSLLSERGQAGGLSGISYTSNPLYGHNRGAEHDRHLNKEGPAEQQSHHGRAINPLHEPSEGTDGDVTTDGEDSEYAPEKSDTEEVVTEEVVDYSSGPVRKIGIISKRGSVSAVTPRPEGIKSKRGSIGPLAAGGTLDISTAVQRVTDATTSEDAQEGFPGLKQGVRRPSLGFDPARRDTIPETVLIEAAKLIVANAGILPTMEETEEESHPHAYYEEEAGHESATSPLHSDEHTSAAGHSHAYYEEEAGHESATMPLHSDEHTSAAGHPHAYYEEEAGGD